MDQRKEAAQTINAPCGKFNFGNFGPWKKVPCEGEGLLKLKNDLIDPSNKLSSWVESGDCCKWIGVFCHNSTGHVNQLHLAAAPLSAPDFDAPCWNIGSNIA
ncbi:hypothetical protein GOBAR_DD11223 [Gossypium barbadense]|nr:hypothetical protein GOBAR_DD11223 [Gossypium barbadense]